MTFHWYGFIIGIAIITAYLLAENKAKQIGISEKFFFNFFIWVLVFSIIGARLWHVATDFYLYDNNLFDVLKIWQGGLSILGVISGGLIGVFTFVCWTARKYKKEIKTPKYFFLQLIDLSGYALPVGQAIGRMANFVNQELYGSPTNLPWKIYIQPQKRAIGYENFEFFHPLFAYEALLMISFWILLNLFLSKNIFKKNRLEFGQGRIFLIYLFFYSLIRFCLDFLRIEKGNFLLWGLGINQLILLLIGSFLVTVILKNKIISKKIRIN